MAESHFFMTRDDTRCFLAFLIDNFSAEFVPEKSTNPPPLRRFTTLKQLEERMDSDEHDSRFFVLAKGWERLPLVLDEIHANDGRHFFSVAQRYGGPAFDFAVSRTFAAGSKRWIVPGFFSDYSYYIEDNAFLADHSLYRTFDRPLQMTQAHKDVRKYLKEHGSKSFCRETGRPGPWILEGAMREFESGAWLRIGEWHFEPKNSASAPSSARLSPEL